MTPAQFVAKWSRAKLPERAASHEHFIDLCRMLGQLKLVHEKLDRAVLAAYADTDLVPGSATGAGGNWSEDWAEVWKDTGAGQPLPADHPLAARRAEVNQKVLANLLRLNQARSVS